VTAKPPGNGRKPRRTGRVKGYPLFLLGSDGEVYACCPAKAPPTRFVRGTQVVIIVRLTRRERDIALDALQIGVKEAARTLSGILKPDA
jgi:hypothetical protein